MNKVVLATASFVSGAALGFVVGYYLNKKEQDKVTEYVEPVYIEDKKPEPEKPQSDILVEQLQIKPAQRATKPGEVGINYSKLVKDMKYKQETQVPPEDDPEDISKESEDDIDMSEYEETYEERVERESREIQEREEAYAKEHEGKIEFMMEDEWDTDFPETDYDRLDLYYFTQSDILTDEDGNVMNEDATIGKNVRQVGWMNNSDEVIYIRNHPQKTEYRVFKEKCSVEDWF